MGLFWSSSREVAKWFLGMKWERLGQIADQDQNVCCLKIVSLHHDVWENWCEWLGDILYLSTYLGKPQRFPRAIQLTFTFVLVFVIDAEVALVEDDVGGHLQVLDAVAQHLLELHRQRRELRPLLGVDVPATSHQLISAQTKHRSWSLTVCDYLRLELTAPANNFPASPFCSLGGAGGRGSGLGCPDKGWRPTWPAPTPGFRNSRRRTWTCKCDRKGIQAPSTWRGLEVDKTCVVTDTANTEQLETGLKLLSNDCKFLRKKMWVLVHSNCTLNFNPGNCLVKILCTNQRVMHLYRVCLYFTFRVCYLRSEI